MKRDLFCAGIGGFSGVVLGAFGAHILKSTPTVHDSLSIWQTAVFYHLIHAVGALAVSLFGQTQDSASRKWLARASAAWLSGITLFSGSLYLLALGAPKWLGPVTPLGGLLLLTGWICVLIGSFKTKSMSRI